MTLAVRELVVQNRQPLTFRRGSGNEQSILEVRVRMGARKPIRDLAIDGGHLFQRELTHVVPFGPEAHLMKESVAFADQTTRLVARRLLLERCQTEL
jgi:hypothetical protein